MTSREERLGSNEALFREVNERIKDVTWSHDNAEFLCECGSETCAVPIRMGVEEYEAVRAHPRRFAIVPGHDIPDVERVVEEHEHYVVVEKLPGVPTEIATETDPRL